jgi:uncharacterized membrane protein YcaP (DUF421 family)
MQDLFHWGVGPLDLAIRAVVVYLSVLLLLRVSGKRQVAQMGATEFVAILLISNAVQNSMNGGDNSLIGGLMIAAILIALSSAIAYFSYKSEKFESIFQGTPRLLVHDSKPVLEALKAELLSKADLHVLLRKQGIQHFSEVKSAVLEADGSLSIVKYVDLKNESLSVPT